MVVVDIVDVVVVYVIEVVDVTRKSLPSLLFDVVALAKARRDAITRVRMSVI